MDVFSKTDMIKSIIECHGLKKPIGILIYRILSLFLLCLLLSNAIVHAQEKGKVAVLPFKVESTESLEHLKLGMQKMLTSLLSEKGFYVISSDAVNEHPVALLSSFKGEDLLNLGRDLEVDWIIHGGLTKIGDRISLDVTVTNSNAVMQPFSVFMVEDNLDMLSDTLSKTATNIYNRISGIIQIDTVLVTGNRRVETDAILAVIESRQGVEFDHDQLDRDLRAVYRMGFFTDVSIDSEEGPNGMIITFNVTEKPVIINISFEGNKQYKEDKLLEEIGLKQYATYNPNDVKQSILSLEEFYRQKGYYHAKISDRITKLPNNEVFLTYVIDEGEKSYITKIEFVGNEVFDDGDLKDIMETTEKGFLSFFTSSGILDANKLEYDVFQITNFYNNNGYLNAKVGEPEIAIQEADKGITITIAIIEGDQYNVGTVSFEGDIIKPESELLDHVTIDEEEAFNLEAMYNDVQALEGVYANEGYAYADITPVRQSSGDGNNLINIKYRIDKKKRVRVERITITGNYITRDKVIRRELKVVEGDFFSGDNLERSTTNLYRLGYFEDIETHTSEGSQDDLMNLDIVVKEQPTGTFSVGAGYSSWEKMIIMGHISQNNLFGKGQSISLEASLGSRTKQFNLRFIEPWVFNRDISAGINIYNWRTAYDEYTKDSKGGSITVGWPLYFIDEDTRASIRYSYDDADLLYLYSLFSGSSLILQDMIGGGVKSSITLSLSRDTKDRPWVTSKGSLNSITYEYSGGVLKGDSYFDKYTFTSEYYFPIWWNTVIVNKGVAGYIKKRPGGRLPIYERFRLGGIDSVRGYEWGDISPVDPATGVRIGGEKMWVYNLEYRIPLAKQQGVIGLVFFDAGNSFDEIEDWKTKTKRSVGFGIRWRSPMGDLRLEYGFKLDKEPGDTSGEFEFSMGGSYY
jgi:outer membrane protein insertion porin family